MGYKAPLSEEELNYLRDQLGMIEPLEVVDEKEPKTLIEMLKSCDFKTLINNAELRPLVIFFSVSINLLFWICCVIMPSVVYSLPIIGIIGGLLGFASTFGIAIFFETMAGFDSKIKSYENGKDLGFSKGRRYARSVIIKNIEKKYDVCPIDFSCFDVPDQYPY